jgi:hypothetical protein
MRGDVRSFAQMWLAAGFCRKLCSKVFDSMSLERYINGIIGGFLPKECLLKHALSYRFLLERGVGGGVRRQLVSFFS